MIVAKWNAKIHEYENCERPDEWTIKTYSDDMDEVINCVHCGKKITYGSGYSSHRYQTNMGFGYCECEECYFSYKE